MRTFARPLLILLAAGMLIRVGYVIAQPRFDPTFARPILDGEYYAELARSGLSGAPGSAYYMPPLYPAMLGVFFAIFGPAWGGLYLAQHVLVVLAAGALGLASRTVGGSVAGVATAALVLLYHPAMFFASRPLGESLALFLLGAATAAALSAGAWSGAGAGWASGLASLARPNLLPLPLLWSLRDLLRGERRRGALLLVGALAAIAPVTCRNYLASGRVVPVSANGGVVFWLGNAPGAIGVYTPAEGFSGKLSSQQAEAVAEASRRTGGALDAVAADRFWLREGVRARAADSSGTAVLLARRVALTLDNAEHGLDYAPGLDRDPVRWLAPVPFAMLLGLAVAAVAARGFAGTGGWVVWSAIGVNALAPIAFYASSRHRLPLAVLLAVPAGLAFAALPGALRGRRGRVSVAAGLAAAALSLSLPTGGLVRSGQAGSLAILADVLRRNGDLAEAEATARRATAIDAGCAVAWFNLGVIEEARAEPAEAESAYRGALRAEPGHAESAGNLSALLLAERREHEAVTLLEAALPASPGHAPLWTNLVVGLIITGDVEKARATIERARSAGVALNPDLVRTVMTMEEPRR